jgi:hypothetical protein
MDKIIAFQRPHNNNRAEEVVESTAIELTERITSYSYTLLGVPICIDALRSILDVSHGMANGLTEEKTLSFCRQSLAQQAIMIFSVTFSGPPSLVSLST